MRKTTLAIVIAAPVAAGLIAAGLTLPGSAHHHHARAAHPVTPALTSPAAPDANTAACRKFARLAPPLDALLGTASADPERVASASGALGALRQAADLMWTWSRTTADKVIGHNMIALPFHLSVAADELRLAAAGMRDPGAPALVAEVVKSVTDISDDCAALSG